MAAASLLAAIVVTWPAAAHLGDHLGAPVVSPDIQCSLWWPQAFADSVVHLRSPFQRTELAWPEGQDIRLIVWTFALQVAQLPLALTLDPIRTLNISLFGVLVANGICVGLAVRRLGGSTTGAVMAAAVAASAGFACAEGGDGRLEQAFFGPTALYLAALPAVRRGGGVALAGVSLAASGALYWFTAYMLVVLSVGLALVWAALDRSLRPFLRLARIGAIALLVALPFLLPVISGMFDGLDFYRSVVDARGVPAELQAAESLRFPDSLFGALSDPALMPARRFSLFGVPLLLLALARRELRPAAGLGLAALVFAFGPASTGLDWRYGQSPLGWPLPLALLDHLPGFERFWWPYRWLSLSFGALFLALGVQATRRPVFGAIVAGLLIVESAWLVRGGHGGSRVPSYEATVPEVFADIAALGGDRPVLQGPLGALPNGLIGYQVFFGQPTDGGHNWSFAEYRSAAWERRLMTVPLWVALERVVRRLDPGPPPAVWTDAETGGYHYVAWYAGSRGSERRRAQQRLDRYLGPHFFEDERVMMWAVPGVGEVPERWR